MHKDILYRFFSGNTTFKEEVEIRNWMESSPDNKETFFRERKLFDAILVSGKTDIYEKFIKDGKKPFYKRKIFTEFAKIAAIIAVTILLTNYFHHLKPEQEPVTMNTISVPAGQRVNLTLSDGTNIWLNARTTLHYPTSFGSGKREVILDGEAYFNVTKDQKRPFVVETGKYEVNVFGTKFNLLAYSEKSNFETSLMDGSLAVKSTSNPKDSVLLTPGCRVFEKDGSLTVSKIPNYDIFRWKEGLICFKDDQFGDIMYEFEKCYGMKIIVNNKKIMKYIYTGKFRQSDGIEHALRVLQKSMYFRYERDDDKYTIYIN
ncbi:anti-sigma factor [Bacteroidia bacterium]|nr:anti-sigma factor [Bacteroidia bacterium]